MTVSNIKELLLRLITTSNPPLQSEIDQLTPGHWLQIEQWIKDHRIGPILHWHLQNSHAHIAVPDKIKLFAQQSYRRSSIKSLSIIRGLREINSILTDAGIDYAVLKGPFLAFKCYPQPGLRPMRDIDIIVHKSSALKTYQILQDFGFDRIPEYSADPLICLEKLQDLPALYGKFCNIKIEVHTRLFRPKDGVTDLADTLDFWERRRILSLADFSVPVESAEDLLLHLILHAAVAHQFNNGPLVLHDIDYLIRSQAIDWPLFWRLAEEQNATHACELVFRLGQKYLPIPVVYSDKALDLNKLEDKLDSMLAITTELLFRNFQTRFATTFVSELNSNRAFYGRLYSLKKRVFPSKSILAMAYSVREDSFLIYFYYLVKWWKLLVSGKELLVVLTDSNLRKESEKIAKLNEWLSN